MSTEEEIRGHAAKAAVYAELATMGSGVQVELAAKAREEAEAAVALGKKDPAAYDQAMKGSGDPQGFKKELETVADKDFNITNTYKPGLDEHASQELNKLGAHRDSANKQDMEQVSHELARKAAAVPTQESVDKYNREAAAGDYSWGGAGVGGEYKSGSERSYQLAAAATALHNMSGGTHDKSNDPVLQAAIDYKNAYEHERSRFKTEQEWKDASSKDRNMEYADHKLANAIGGETPVHGNPQLSRQEFARYMPENGMPGGVPGTAAEVIKGMGEGVYGVKGDLAGIVAKYPEAAKQAVEELHAHKYGTQDNAADLAAEKRIREAMGQSAPATDLHAEVRRPAAPAHLSETPHDTLAHVNPAEKKIIAQSQETPQAPGKANGEPFTELSAQDKRTLESIAGDLGAFKKDGTVPVMDEKTAMAALGKLAHTLESANLGELPKQILKTVENYAEQKSRG